MITYFSVSLEKKIEQLELTEVSVGAQTSDLLTILQSVFYTTRILQSIPQE